MTTAKMVLFRPFYVTGMLKGTSQPEENQDKRKPFSQIGLFFQADKDQGLDIYICVYIFPWKREELTLKLKG